MKKYLSLGKLLVAGYAPKTAKVVVVPVNGATANTAAIIAKLNATYNGIGIQWDAVHAPGLVIGVFEGDEDAMITSNAFFWTPSGHIIYVGDAEKGITDYKIIDRGEMPNGALNA